MGTVHIGGQFDYMVNFGFGSRTVLLGCTMNLIPSPTGIGVGTVGGRVRAPLPCTTGGTNKILTKCSEGLKNIAINLFLVKNDLYFEANSL